jgi:hypothetical protein
MTLALLLEQLFNGVQFGLMLFLMAVGVTLVFGIMRVINLAHGALFMLGGYFLMAALAWTQSYALAVPLALIGGALVAIVLEIVVLRPLYRRGPLDQVLATFGLSLFFNEAVTVIWGRESIPLSIPPFLTGSVEIIPGAAYPIYRLVITGVAIVAGLLLYLLITRTRVGALIPRRQRQPRDRGRARHQYQSALYARIRAQRDAGRARRHHDGTAAVGRARRRRPDPHSGARGGRDRRDRLGARRPGGRADGRHLRHAQPRAHSRW